MVDAQQSEVVADRANDECVSPRGTSKPSQVRPRIAGGVARPPHWPAIKTIVTSSLPLEVPIMAHRRVSGAVDLYRLAGGAVGSEDPMGIATRLFFAQRRTPTLGLPASTSTRPGALGSTPGGQAYIRLLGQHLARHDRALEGQDPSGLRVDTPRTCLARIR